LPKNAAAEKLRTTEKALKTGEAKAQSEGELKACIFKGLESGKSLTRIVIDLKAGPK